MSTPRGTVTAASKLSAVRRELAYRRRVYPRLVAEGKLREDTADFQLRVMEAIEADYAAQVEPKPQQGRLF